MHPAETPQFTDGCNHILDPEFELVGLRKNATDGPKAPEGD